VIGWISATRGTTVSDESLELNCLPLWLNSLSQFDSLVSHKISLSAANAVKREIPAGLELAVVALSALAAIPVPTG
jgi:ABC-type antimicrobial peptide transport system permease subunit